MSKPKISVETRRAIKSAQEMINTLLRRDGNEAETRRRAERIFENLLGYDALEHLSRERAVQGAAETEHVDFAINLKPDDPPVMLIELKRAGIDLALKHLKQVTSYAIDAGCEWVLLTNTREWKVYHIEFGQPPKTVLLEQWDLLSDDIASLAASFELISYKSIKRGLLEERWRQTKVLEPKNLLAALLSQESLRLLKRQIRKNTGVLVEYESIVSGIRKLLNEAAATELDEQRIQIPTRKPPARRQPKKEVTQPESAAPIATSSLEPGESE